VAYHGDLEKKAIMELKREKEENGDAHGNSIQTKESFCTSGVSFVKIKSAQIATTDNLL